MRTAALLFLALAAGLAVWLGTRSPPPPPAPPREPPPEWAGSESCEACHPDIYARWSKTAHADTIRDFNADTTRKPFDGEYFVARDIEHRLGPGATMECEGPGGATATFPVDAVIGVRRIQMYLTRMDGGRIQVLPVFLEVEKSRWFDYADFIFGGPSDFEIKKDSSNSWYTFGRNFNSRCGSCHTTRYDVGYDADTGRYDTTWSERRIGCESCHGASGGHVDHWQRKAEGEDPIVNPSRLPVDRANQVCGACHAEGEVVVPGYRPGDDLFSFLDPAGLEDKKHFYADGRASELTHNFVPILESPCGPISCTRCHDPHGRGIPGDLYRPIGDWACVSCHEEIGNDVEAHTHHTATGAGSRCVNCHMPRMVIEGGHGRVFDHTISIPSIENTRRFGLPNACRDCHRTEDPGWEYESFERWYPDAGRKNHRVALAAAIGGARRGEAGAEPGLVALLKDGNPVYRAGAAWSLSRYEVDLRPQLSDAHPMVVRGAIKGVARLHPDALVPLLEHANMVLRRAAAFALAEKRVAQPYDYIRTRPELRERVLAVIEASTRLTPDRARLHFTAGALHEIAGRKKEAVRAYDRYLRLHPWNAGIRSHADSLR